jgi:hypothetical protein
MFEETVRLYPNLEQDLAELYNVRERIKELKGSTIGSVSSRTRSITPTSTLPTSPAESRGPAPQGGGR